MNTVISASILSADLRRLESEINRAQDAGCDYIHFDVMDGVFVDNISYGLPVLKSVKSVSRAVLDVHLMIINPLKYVKAFSDAGADIITFHFEADSDVSQTIAAIKACGRKAGLSVKPQTPIDVILPYLEQLDMVLIMTVEPGFGGQGLINETLDKIRALDDIIKSKNLRIPIQADGGINLETAAAVKEAGASILVAGDYLFHAEDMGEAVRLIRD